ncbi:hypothetical protein HSBAA_02820 [Vreelandella sulfidaeris]|uniref:Transporter n=1 Tax=Vreelandella sulfidaeris TaxID=115553 RepID=A0A455TZN0_9GAMM|nr:hypothetical protein HSBAA_02820 [Halomonas sulfidaeris]
MSGHNVWTHKGTFLLAAVGSAVGLGNLWRFPYLAGENGGGAFILVYALTIFAVGIPILIAEILLGRNSRQSPIMGMRHLTKTHGTSRAWGNHWLAGRRLGIFDFKLLFGDCRLGDPLYLANAYRLANGGRCPND